MHLKITLYLRAKKKLNEQKSPNTGYLSSSISSGLLYILSLLPFFLAHNHCIQSDYSSSTKFPLISLFSVHFLSRSHIISNTFYCKNWNPYSLDRIRDIKKVQLVPIENSDLVDPSGRLLCISKFFRYFRPFLITVLAPYKKYPIGYAIKVKLGFDLFQFLSPIFSSVSGYV